MITDTRKIFGLLLSVGFSSIGFIAAITVTVLAAREVSSNPLYLGFPNAVGVGGAFLGTQMFYKISKKYSSCLLYTSPSPRDRSLSRMPSSA